MVSNKLNEFQFARCGRIPQASSHSCEAKSVWAQTQSSAVPWEKTPVSHISGFQLMWDLRPHIQLQTQVQTMCPGTEEELVHPSSISVVQFLPSPLVPLLPLYSSATPPCHDRLFFIAVQMTDDPNHLPL